MEWFIKAFIRASLVWFLAGILLGVAMAWNPAWVAFRPAHAHMTVAGFLSMLVFGVGYQLLPRLFGHPLRSTRLAIAHLILANLGLLLIVVGFFIQPYRADAHWVTAAGGILFATGALLWVYNLWLMASWLPTYLVKGRGFSVGEMGVVGGVITGAALVGTVWGGWCSDFLIRRGFQANTARKTFPLVSMLLGAPFMIAGVSVESQWLCIGLLMGARFFNDSALAGYMSLPTEMSPRHLGAIWGCMSTFGSLSGMVAAMLAGYQVDTTGNWALPFYTAAGLITLAAAIMALGVSAQPLFVEQERKEGALHPKPVG